MLIHERYSTRGKKDRILSDIYQEVQQLRAATQVYTTLVQQVLSLEMAHHANAPVTPSSRAVSFKAAD